MRNAGFVAAVSARALIISGMASGSLAHAGINPQRTMANSRPSPEFVDRITAIGCVGAMFKSVRQVRNVGKLEEGPKSPIDFSKVKRPHIDSPPFRTPDRLLSHRRVSTLDSWSYWIWIHSLELLQQVSICAMAKFSYAAWRIATDSLVRRPRQQPVRGGSQEHPWPCISFSRPIIT